MKKKLLIALVALLSVGVSLYAASAEELYQKFSDATDSGDVALAIDTYNDLQERTDKDLQKAQRSYEKALAAGNMQRAWYARDSYRSILHYSMSEEDTDALLAAILKEDEATAAEHAKWLYSNSSYYYPTLTYEWKSSSDTFSYSYSRSVTVEPGTSITLPGPDDIGIDSSMAGVLVGWGVTPDEATYSAGETISAPLTSQTLYAIWKSEVRFTDSVTGVESVIDDVASGDSVAVPQLTAPDSSYVFAGWEDESTGVYLAPDDTEYALEGNGAVFKALWKKVDISALEGKHYDASALPVNTQAELSFTVSNAGTEDLRSLSVDIEGSDGLTVLTGSGRISFIRDGSSITMTGLKVVATESGEHAITVTITDRDGDVWEKSFTVSAE